MCIGIKIQMFVTLCYILKNKIHVRKVRDLMSIASLPVEQMDFLFCYF